MGSEMCIRDSSSSVRCRFCSRWPCQFYKNKTQEYCCHKCKRTSGQQHNPYCVSRGGEGDTGDNDVFGSRCMNSRQEARVHRSRSPKRYSVSASERIVLSLGRKGRHGKSLLEQNPELARGEICVDAEAILKHNEGRDGWRQRGGPDGRHLDTQSRLRLHPSFPACCREIHARVLTQELTVVKCRWGKHRSVGCLEMSVRDLRKCEAASDLQIQVYHLDRDGVSSKMWQYLSAYTF